MEDVFSFDDFLNKSGSKRPEPINFIDDEDFDDKKTDSFISQEADDNFEKEVEELEDFGDIKANSDSFFSQETDESFEKEEETYESTNENAFVQNVDEDDDFYKLYQDKNEEFTCDIMVEGSSPEETYARIIVESENWSLVFPGEIINGKCIVPIKKLNILKEGEVGNIKLEVVAEGNLFIPWENQFKVKMSKKVTVMMNENKKQQSKKPIINNKIGVRVNVK